MAEHFAEINVKWEKEILMDKEMGKNSIGSGSYRNSFLIYYVDIVHILKQVI
jgi:hypothetical protein